MNKASCLIFALTFFLFPASARAAVIISEIMYDLEIGSDTGREWIEVVNDGTEPVDISTWKFFEDATSHALTALGSAVVPPGGYAVIVHTPDKFLADWPQFSGLMFDSSWSSLSNAGETLAIKNPEGVVVDQITYASESGGNGDGNSLNRSGSIFVAALPTPGSGGSSSSSSPSEESQGEGSEEGSGETSESSTPLSELPPIYASSGEQKIFADAGKDKIAVVGASIEFFGKAMGTNKEPLQNASYLWNFGDGGIK